MKQAGTVRVVVVVISNVLGVAGTLETPVRSTLGVWSLDIVSSMMGPSTASNGVRPVRSRMSELLEANSAFASRRHAPHSSSNIVPSLERAHHPGINAFAADYRVGVQA